MDKRRFELVLDSTAIAAVVVYFSLAASGVLTWAAVSWTLGLFTGWMLRHLLH